MLHHSPLKPALDQEAASRIAGRTPSPDADRPGAATGHPGDEGAAEFIPWGPPDEHGDVSCEILATLGSVEVEYAHIRRDLVRFDATMRGTIRVEGDDARDFLDRMLTQKLAAMASGSGAMAFLVDRKGRLQADLKLLHVGDSILIDVDVHQASAVVEILNGFVFSEDVRIVDETDHWHRIELHGPECERLFEDLEPMRGKATTIAGHEVHALRHDRLGVAGIDLFVRYDQVVDVWLELDCTTTGWFAYNMARIEGGSPLCNIDFGPGMLPHETGLVPSRVSFSKGCYPGQEIVARLEHLGQPKQFLRGLKMAADVLPVAGSQVFAEGEGDLGQPIGVVTSSCLSPMLGSVSIAFAMLRTKVSEPGTAVRVHDEGKGGSAITTSLDFLSVESDE